MKKYRFRTSDFLASFGTGSVAARAGPGQRQRSQQSVHSSGQIRNEQRSGTQRKSFWLIPVRFPRAIHQPQDQKRKKKKKKKKKKEKKRSQIFFDKDIDAKERKKKKKNCASDTDGVDLVISTSLFRKLGEMW